MSVIWNNEQLTPEAMIKVLEEQRRNWLDTAEAFERLKTYLTGTFSLQDAEASARLCRARAEKLQEMIAELQMQYQVDPESIVEQPRPPYLQ